MPRPKGLPKTGGRRKQPETPRLEIVYRPIAWFQPYERNPRKNDKAVDRIRASIKEFGFAVPILARSTGEVIDGHLRLKGGIAEKLADLPVILCDGWTDAQVKAFRLMVNRSVGWADWDVDALALEFADLKALDFDLQLTGFDSREIDQFTLSVNPTEDDVPPVPEVPITKPGDLWLLGPHRLLCGDSTSATDVGRLMDSRRVNLAFTSPPYAEQREYDKASVFRPIKPVEYVDWYRPTAENIKSILEPDGSYFLNIKPPADGLDTDLYVFDLVIAHVRQWGFHFATEFCWERNGVPKGVTQRFKNQFEPVYQFAMNRWKMRPDAVRHASDNVPRAGGPGSGETSWGAKQGGDGARSVSGSFGAAKKRRNKISANQGAGGSGIEGGRADLIVAGMAYPGNRLPTFTATHEATGHTAAFPVGLPEFFIHAYTDAGDTVYDPFAGSGSTLIATERTARAGFAMECSPAYCDCIVARWEKLTGRKATLEAYA